MIINKLNNWYAVFLFAKVLHLLMVLTEGYLNENRKNLELAQVFY
jgi:hypothetical protein